MLIKKIYIIGNGFDLHHGIKSRYMDFRKYLENENDELLEKLEIYYNPSDLWSDFEKTMARLDTEEIVDECIDYIQPYSAEDWSDAYHHDYQYEVQRRIDLITVTLKEYFTRWVLQLRLPEDVNDSLVSIDRSATFINFNYTDTLERIYKVSEQNIFYIHNKAIDINSTLIIGHSRKPKKISYRIRHLMKTTWM